MHNNLALNQSFWVFLTIARNKRMPLYRDELLHRRAESAQSVFFYLVQSYFIKISQYLYGIDAVCFHEEPIGDDFSIQIVNLISSGCRNTQHLYVLF